MTEPNKTPLCGFENLIIQDNEIVCKVCGLHLKADSDIEEPSKIEWD